MSESKLLMNIRKNYNKGIRRLWRNNVGMYKRDNYVIKYGVANPGGSDLIGGTQIVITSDMVGATLLIFTAIETKAKGRKPTQEQKDFIDNINRMGGFAGVAYIEQDTEKISNPQIIIDRIKNKI